MSWKKAWSVIEDYLVITFGVFVYVLAWTAFMIPNGVASGGLTGACTILEMGTGIPVAYSYVVINAILIVVGSLILGRGFGFKTIYAILLATLLFDLLPRVDVLVAGNLSAGFYTRHIALATGTVLKEEQPRGARLPYFVEYLLKRIRTGEEQHQYCDINLSCFFHVSFFISFALVQERGKMCIGRN